MRLTLMYASHLMFTLSSDGRLPLNRPTEKRGTRLSKSKRYVWFSFGVTRGSFIFSPVPCRTQTCSFPCPRLPNIVLELKGIFLQNPFVFLVVVYFVVIASTYDHLPRVFLLVGCWERNRCKTYTFLILAIITLHSGEYKCRWSMNDRWNRAAGLAS